MDIFDKQIFGKDAEDWLNFCKTKKRDWILKHTNQKNESLINDFIENPRISKSCKCTNCGDKRKRISNENETVVEPNNIDGIGGDNSNERPKNSKRKKSK